jgi:tetratricopeptide (TPR) repeat protein
MISHLHNLAVQVLSEDESNVKALFRRGKAKSELGQTESAREDFLKAKKYLPEDKEILRELRSLAEQDKLHYQKQRVIQRSLWSKASSKTEEAKLPGSVLAVARVLYRLPR